MLGNALLTAAHDDLLLLVAQLHLAIKHGQNSTTSLFRFDIEFCTANGGGGRSRVNLDVGRPPAMKKVKQPAREAEAGLLLRSARRVNREIAQFTELQTFIS